jgi:hypothetical protein
MITPSQCRRGQNSIGTRGSGFTRQRHHTRGVTGRANRALTRCYVGVWCYSRPVTKRAEEAVWAVESSPRVPRGELSGRFAARRKETQKEHRSFGTIIETRGRFKVRYTGPDRKIHRAGITFTTRERAQGWLFEERKLIELREWAPPSLRRAQLHKDELTLDEFARDWIAKRLVRGRPLSLAVTSTRPAPPTRRPRSVCL